MKSIFVGFIFLLTVTGLSGQSLSSGTDSLMFWGDIMTNAGMITHRQLAQEHFRDCILRSMRSSPEFGDSLETVPWVSVQRPPSDTFRLVTWQWKDEGGVIRNHGIFQYRGDTAMIVLHDLKRQIGRPQQRVLRAPKWIGARYFQLIPFISGGEDVFVLLGYDGYSEKETVQIIEFLSFEEGHPVFGGSFLRDSSSQVRLDRRILRYMEGAQVKVTYDENKQRIVFDHLRRIEHPGMPGGSSWIPDGTYEAYQLENGYWKYDEKVYQRILDRPPVNRPEGRDEDKDLFGRPQKDDQ